MTAPEVLPDHELATLLRDAPGGAWRCSATASPRACASRIAGYLDLSWVDRIEASLRTAAPTLAVLNLGRRNLLAAEVRERQLAPALAFRPDLAIVAAGGNDALRRSFDPGAVERSSSPRRRAAAARGRRRAAARADGHRRLRPRAARARAALDARMRPLAALTRRVARRHGAILVRCAATRLGRPRRLRERPPAPQRARPRDRRQRGDPRPRRGDPGEGRGMSDLRIDVTEAEILADLSWPGPPPGRWSTEQRAGEAAGAGGERAAGDGGRRQQREADQDAQHRVADRGAVEQRDGVVV